MITTLTVWQKRLLLVLAGVAVLALFGLAFTAGRVSAGPDHPDTASADAGFARDMQVHHAQAVEMSLLIRDRSKDEAVRLIAYDIALTQQQQIGQMYAWLEEWNLPQSPAGPRMAWMAAGGADHHGGDSGTHSSGSAGALMPGMATADQISELTDASGVEAERLYLTLMIDHHEAGAEMAQAGMELADTAKVRELASKMVAAQRSEISALQKLLEQR